LTLSGPVGPPDRSPEPPEPDPGDGAAAAGAVERLVTSGVPGWRLVAGLIALVWIYRRRVLLPAAVVTSVVVVTQVVLARR
jgi:hypothetical protein